MLHSIKNVLSLLVACFAIGAIADQQINKFSVGTLEKVVTAVKNPAETDGKKFRTPCRSDNKCGKIIRRLMVPKVAQLENIIMSVNNEMEHLPIGAKVPDKNSKTEPWLLLLDGNYRERVCTGSIEECVREDRRRRRILKKLIFKKYNYLRKALIGYGGRNIWGGEGNLFYKK